MTGAIRMVRQAPAEEPLNTAVRHRVFSSSVVHWPTSAYSDGNVRPCAVHPAELVRDDKRRRAQEGLHECAYAIGGWVYLHDADEHAADEEGVQRHARTRRGEVREEGPQAHSGIEHVVPAILGGEPTAEVPSGDVAVEECGQQPALLCLAILVLVRDGDDGHGKYESCGVAEHAGQQAHKHHAVPQWDPTHLVQEGAHVEGSQIDGRN
eukprot:647992-Prorocentrum_minimum.AAC.2